jgi:hypothetical protein
MFLVASLCNQVTTCTVKMTLADKIVCFRSAREAYGSSLSLDKLYQAIQLDKFPFFNKSIGSLKHIAALEGAGTRLMHYGLCLLHHCCMLV